MINIIELLQQVFYFMLYIGNSNEFPRPLNAADEQKYLKLFKEENDANARKILIEKNLRLVAHIIKKYYAHTSDINDLISIGTIGLIKGIDSFDYTKGTRLATYVARCIENEILMHFRYTKKTACEISMQDEIDCDKEGNALTLMDVVSSDECIVETLEKKNNIKKLFKFLKQDLDKREQQIIFLRYGIHNGPPLTQREIAKQLNISRSYVSRIEKKALEKLKKHFELNDVC